MKKDYTEICLILDCSSSMSSIKSAIIEGYNSFIEAQKEVPGECSLALTKFSDQVEVGSLVGLESVAPLTDQTYVTSGMTALWKAIVDSCNAMGTRLADTPEQDRPEKVLVVIITDGKENASNSTISPSFIKMGHVNADSEPELYTLDKVKAVIEHQKSKYNWEFMFIGTENLDVNGISGSMGINHSMVFRQDRIGTQSMYGELTRSVAAYRSGKDL